MSAAWTAYKLYVGQGVDQLDHLIADVVPGLLRATPHRAWCFDRAADGGGAHLRLRVQLEPERAQADTRAVQRALDSAVRALVTRPPGSYRGLIADDETAPQAGSSARGVVVDTADAGGERFGEELGELGSELAVELLRADLEGLVSRKTVAPLLMEGALRGVAPELPGARFWPAYAELRLAQVGGAAADRWQARFRAKADRLGSAGLAIAADPASLPAAVRAAVERWSAGSAACCAPFAGAERERRLADCVHGMNNRLGITPLEEAYLATLLAHAAAGA